MNRLLIAVCVWIGLGASAPAQDRPEPRPDGPRVERERPPREADAGPRERAGYGERRERRGAMAPQEPRRERAGERRRSDDDLPGPRIGRGEILRRMWFRRQLAERMRELPQGSPGWRAEAWRRRGMPMAPQERFYEMRRGRAPMGFDREALRERLEMRRERGAPLPPRFDREALRERLEMRRGRGAPLPPWFDRGARDERRETADERRRDEGDAPGSRERRRGRDA